MILVFLKDGNLVIKRRLLRLQKSVFQQIARGIPGSRLLELIDIFLRLIKAAAADIQLGKSVQNGLAGRRTSVCILQDRPAVIIALIRFIDLADHAQRARASDMSPVDLIRGFGCTFEITAFSQRVDCLQFDFIFGFIQLMHSLF